MASFPYSIRDGQRIIVVGTEHAPDEREALHQVMVRGHPDIKPERSYAIKVGSIAASSYGDEFQRTADVVEDGSAVSELEKTPTAGGHLYPEPVVIPPGALTPEQAKKIAERRGWDDPLSNPLEDFRAVARELADEATSYPGLTTEDRARMLEAIRSDRLRRQAEEDATAIQQRLHDASRIEHEVEHHVDPSDVTGRLTPRRQPKHSLRVWDGNGVEIDVLTGQSVAGTQEVRTVGGGYVRVPVQRTPTNKTGLPFVPLEEGESKQAPGSWGSNPSSPIADILAAKKAIEEATSRIPNQLIIPTAADEIKASGFADPSKNGRYRRTGPGQFTKITDDVDALVRALLDLSVHVTKASDSVKHLARQIGDDITKRVMKKMADDMFKDILNKRPLK